MVAYYGPEQAVKLHMLSMQNQYIIALRETLINF